jgi:hypothetical protein
MQPHLITPAPLPLSHWERGRGVAVVPERSRREGRGVRERSIICNQNFLNAPSTKQLSKEYVTGHRL